MREAMDEAISRGVPAEPGISTYAYFWRELTLPEMLEDAARLGAEVFQVCDCPEVETIDRRALAAAAQEHGVELELDTRGLERAHLERHLEYADELGATMLRTMVVPGAPNDRGACWTPSRRAIPTRSSSCGSRTSAATKRPSGPKPASPV